MDPFNSKQPLLLLLSNPVSITLEHSICLWEELLQFYCLQLQPDHGQMWIPKLIHEVKIPL